MSITLIESISGAYKVDFIFLALLVTCLELLYQECLQKNMIFQQLGLLLQGLYNADGNKRKLAMIIGYCRYCNAFWMGLIIYVLYFNSLSLNTLLFCGLTHVYLKTLTLIIAKISL